MDNQKTFEFNGKAGGYFVVFLVSLIGAYIPFFGWAWSFNFTNAWIAKNSKISGKSVSYNAAYIDTLVFFIINTLLLIITLGIYVFWFVPKSYRYIADNLTIVDSSASAPAPTPAPVAPTAAPTPPQPTIVQ